MKKAHIVIIVEWRKCTKFKTVYTVSWVFRAGLKL